MSNTPEPAFVSIKKEPPYEIRSYQTLTVAEITLEGERKNTLQTGFRHLFKYIFGHNETQKRISMTAPVIHFCAPNNNQQWVTRFIMPDNMPHKETPKPNFKPINIIQLPATKYAVIKFSGFSWFYRFQKKKSELEIFCNRNKISHTKTPIFAYYNAPWTLPWLRRNEVMLAITETSTTNHTNA